MPKSWTITGISERTRNAVSQAASEAGLPIAAWVEKALQLALEDGLEPGVAVDELADRVRRVLNEELQPVQVALGRLEEGVGQVARQQESTIGGLSAVELARARMRERRAR